MDGLGKGLVAVAICTLVIVCHPLGWIGMLIIAWIFGAFR
jgi:hypothetical protein